MPQTAPWCLHALASLAPLKNVRFCGRYWGKADMPFCPAHVCL